MATIHVRIKGLEECKAAIRQAEAELPGAVKRELKKGADKVRNAAGASAGGGRLGGSYRVTDGGATSWIIGSDLIYAPVQEFAIDWGREVHSKKTGKPYHQEVHYKDHNVPRHLYPALDVVGPEVVDGEEIYRVMSADGWLGDG